MSCCCAKTLQLVCGVLMNNIVYNILLFCGVFMRSDNHLAMHCIENHPIRIRLTSFPDAIVVFGEVVL